MLSNFVLQTCLVAASMNFPCSEALAIAQIESEFNTEAVGSVGELGAWQVRPEFFGPAPKHLTPQAVHAIFIMRRIRAVCYPALSKEWFVCYNRGVKGGLKRGRGTAYAARAVRIAKQWERLLRPRRLPSGIVQQVLRPTYLLGGPRPDPKEGHGPYVRSRH